MGFSIGKKLVVNLGVAIVTVLILVMGSYFAMSRLGQLQDEGYHRALESKDGLHAAHLSPIMYQIVADGMLNRNMVDTEAAWKKTREDGDKLLAELRKYSNSSEEKQWAEQGSKAYGELVALVEGKLFPLLKTTTEITPEMRAIDGELDKSMKVMEESFQKYAASMAKEAEEADALYDRTRSAAIRNSLLLGGLGLAFLIGVSVWIRNGITSPLKRLMGVLSDVAHGEGDLTARLPVEGSDEVTEVSRSFNTFIEKVHDIILHVSRSTVQLADASAQLLGASQSAAEGAENVAGQASAVATASEEMSATSIDIAQNCGRAAEGSQQANCSAMTGADVVRNTVDVMHSIAERVRNSSQTIAGLGERSDQIGAIVGTIEDIADQTNLLALNAAIEAARAGEQGRGFAVVADEVRALAERTTKATKEIGEMIRAIQQETRQAVSTMEEGVHEVENGTSEAAKSGSALDEILAGIQNVSMQVAQIATAAEEQNATTSEITNNIHVISQVVSQTANASLDSAREASRLAKVSEELQAEVKKFKTHGSDLMILELAKNDHLLFVRRIKAVTHGMEEMDASQVSTHMSCRFGKWYYGDGQALCGTLTSFRNIEGVHEQIHALAKDAVQKFNSGDRGGAVQLFTKVEELSHKVVSALDDIHDEVMRQRKAA